MCDCQNKTKHKFKVKFRKLDFKLRKIEFKQYSCEFKVNNIYKKYLNV